MLAVEGSGDPDTSKKAKVDDPGKEFAGLATCRALAAADKPRGFDKQYCKIHRTKGHDLQNCRQVELLAEKQKAEYERRNKDYQSPLMEAYVDEVRKYWTKFRVVIVDVDDAEAKAV